MQISDSSSDEECEDNIEICSTKSVAVDEHVFKEHKINENTINDVQSAESNVSNSVELSQMTTSKNLKVSQKKTDAWIIKI